MTVREYTKRYLGFTQREHDEMITALRVPDEYTVFRFIGCEALTEEQAEQLLPAPEPKVIWKAAYGYERSLARFADVDYCSPFA